MSRFARVTISLDTARECLRKGIPVYARERDNQPYNKVLMITATGFVFTEQHIEDARLFDTTDFQMEVLA